MLYKDYWEVSSSLSFKAKRRDAFFTRRYPGMGFLEGVVDALTLSLFKEHLDDVLNNML